MFEDQQTQFNAALGMLTQGASGLGDAGKDFEVPANPLQGDNSTTPMFTTPGAVQESAMDVADLLAGLPGRQNGEFATSLMKAAGDYRAAFEKFGMDLQTLQPKAPDNEGGTDYPGLIQSEFTAAATAFAAAGDAILTAAAIEVGSDNNNSGVAYAADALIDALDASGGTVSGALANGGLDVLTAASGRFIDEVTKGSMELMGLAGEGQDTPPPMPGTEIANFIEENNALPGAIDDAFNALTGDAVRTLAGELGNGADGFADQIGNVADQLAKAISGEGSNGSSPLDQITDQLDPSALEDVAGQLDPSALEEVAGQLDPSALEDVAGQLDPDSFDTSMLEAVTTPISTAVETFDPMSFNPATLMG